MAEVVTAQGLVLAVTSAAGDVYPFACTTTASITINRDFIELAPKTNGVFREYIKGRSGYTVSGSGLVKMVESYTQPITFFDTFIEGSDSEFIGYLDIVDASGNYKVYKFSCIVQDLTLTNATGQNASYSFTLQGTGPLTEITVVDSYTVASGKITSRSTASYKLIGVAIDGVWYYNYTVTDEGGGVFTITIGASFNGETVKAAYLQLF
jgi:hypothetical protein